MNLLDFLNMSLYDDSIVEVWGAKEGELLEVDSIQHIKELHKKLLSRNVLSYELEKDSDFDDGYCHVYTFIINIE